MTRALRCFTPLQVDDAFPCKKGTCKPMFTDPNGTEMWVMVLEKAFAKFVGSYGYATRTPALPSTRSLSLHPRATRRHRHLHVRVAPPLVR